MILESISEWHSLRETRRTGLIGEDVTFLEEVYHWRWVWGCQTFKQGPVSLSSGFLRIMMKNSQLLIQKYDCLCVRMFPVLIIMN